MSECKVYRNSVHCANHELDKDVCVDLLLSVSLSNMFQKYMFIFQCDDWST